ncbi:hypothetical protein CEXT_340961, partial [Caerostris extrusa]
PLNDLIQHTQANHNDLNSLYVSELLTTSTASTRRKIL